MRKTCTVFFVVMLVVTGFGCSTMRSQHRSVTTLPTSTLDHLPTLTGTVKKVLSKDGVHFVKLSR